MDFKQLETFVTLSKLKSFSKTAEYLYLTQPTISNHIQSLEEELQSILINRSNKNISLTKSGEIFFKYALDILNKRDTAIFSINKFKGEIKGVLEISASTIPEQYFLPNLLVSFNKKFPDVKYNLKKYDSSEVIEKILSGEIDFGMVGAKKNYSQLEYIEIMDDEIVLVSSSKGKFSFIESLSPHDLIKYPLIFREEGSGTRKIVEDILAKNNISSSELQIIATIENTETIKECIKKDIGLSFISKRAVSNDILNNVLKEIPINSLKITRNFYLVYHKTRPLSPLTKTFKTFILENVK